MKIYKSFIAVCLCCALIVCFAACGKQEEEVTTTVASSSAEQTEEKLRSLEEVKLSVAKLKKANSVEKLLEKYDTVTVESKNSDSSEYIIQVFKYEDETALVEWVKANNGGTSVSGWIKGFDFSVGENGVEACRNIELLSKKAEFAENEAVSSLFDGVKLAVAEVTDGHYKLKSLSEDKSKNGIRCFYFDKETLVLTKITYENAVGNTETTTVTCNGELNEHSKKITDAFDGEMKTVHIKGQYDNGYEIEDVDVKLSLPSDWEYVPGSVDRIDYSTDADFIEEYYYPGHGESYTLYVTNIFDDDIAGKK